MSILWPEARVAEAIAAVARAGGLPVDDAPKPGDPSGRARTTPGSVTTSAAVLKWAAFSAEQLGLEAELVSCSFREVDALLRSLGPALLPVQEENGLAFLALVESRGSSLSLVAPDGRIVKRSIDEVRTAVASTLEGKLRSRGLLEMIEAAGVPPARRERVFRAIAVDQYGAAPMGPFIMLRPHPAASMIATAQHAGVVRTTAILALLHIARTAAVVASFYLLGRGALEGRLEVGWLIAWALSLISTIPLTAIGGYAQGRFAIVMGRLIKQRLLYGTLRMAPDTVRHEGAGGMLGRVLESTAVEAMVLAGSLGAILALVELAFAAWVIASGAGGVLSVAILVVYSLVTALVVYRFYVKSRAWTDQRLALTHDLVERMVGHRTRLAQEPVEEWHAEEDRVLEGYLERSHDLDRRGALWVSLLPRGWVLLAALGLGPAFLAGTADGASMAVGVGGIVLGLNALTALSSGLAQLASAAIAWRRVQPIFRAATQLPPPGDVETLLAESDQDESRPVIEARGVSFRYPGRERMVLDECSIAIQRGERVLLVGPSGGGKSTLAALLGGLRDPSSGVLLLDGLDPRSIGAAAWRERVATVPQFHENHVLSASFAFNALMGAEWPPSPAKLKELEEVCEELGLGPLLARMPARFEQTVGENGWRLSHGERSRLFLARALLAKDARLWILDESFAALDPVTLERCVRAVLRRARTLLVVAHP